jgi:hypothetical protein
MTLLALFMVAAQAGPTVSSPGAPVRDEVRRLPLRVCSAVLVGAPQTRRLPARQPTDLKFSSRQVLDLEFRARLLRDLEGDHLLQLKVLTPNGFLYQVITVPFVSSAPAAGPGGSRQTRTRDTSVGDAQLASAAASSPPPRYVPGFPRPLPVQRLRPVAGDTANRIQYELDARLPVAGTSITLSSLYGRWTVQPYLDGRPDPCGPATRFTIEE